MGCCPGKKVSMIRMRLPQQGQGCSGAFGSSDFVWAVLMASIAMSGTASSSRIRAMLLARAGEQAVVTDTMEALRQDVHQEATDELVGIERHHRVSLATFEAVVLPLEGDALVIERDQAAVGDGDAMGVAGEIAQDFRGSPEWAFAVDHPLTVAQRRQIGGEGLCMGERDMFAEEL